MPTFLTTSGTAHIIEDIIIRAKSELVLITPYLKLSRILSERLTEANQRGVNITLVYGKSELHPEERKRLDALSHLTLLYLENLHAKCYYNEHQLIISSMNLYEFSEKNNREMGIVLTRRDDEECFADALAEAQSIIAAARGTSTATRSTAESVPKTSLSALWASPAETEQRERKRKLLATKVHELLSLAFAHTRFDLQEYAVHAKNFPRSGVHFTYDGTIRLDFQNSKVYDSTKANRREKFDQLLSAYRCYWNRDVIQIYSAKSYSNQDEQATAAYYVEAVQKAAEALHLRIF